MEYEEWLDKVATIRNTTAEALEEQYGDMMSDLYDLGDSPEEACGMCNADDEEYSHE